MDTTLQFHESRSEDRAGVIHGSKRSEEFRNTMLTKLVPTALEERLI